LDANLPGTLLTKPGGLPIPEEPHANITLRTAAMLLHFVIVDSRTSVKGVAIRALRTKEIKQQFPGVLPCLRNPWKSGARHPRDCLDEHCLSPAQTSSAKQGIE
jgi:hypothetical protein